MFRGEPGIGKSRLAAKAIELAEGSGAAVLEWPRPWNCWVKAAPQPSLKPVYGMPSFFGSRGFNT